MSGLAVVPQAAVGVAAGAGGAGAGVPTAVAAAEVASPMDVLAGYVRGLLKRLAVKALRVEQGISAVEVVSGCDMPNRFSVYEADAATRAKSAGYPLFFCQEESSCFQRQCCGGDRGFTMPVYQRHPTEEAGRGPILMNLTRPFKCCESCFCLNRGEVFVRNAAGDEIAHVDHPFTCCSWDLTVGPAKDGKGAHPWYRLSASACQPGVYCQLPCGSCSRIAFHITDASGAKVGEVCRVWSGCLKEAVTDADNYVIVFPEDATVEGKAGILAATLFIDFIWFTKTFDDDGESN